jgi:hypothetical protein
VKAGPAERCDPRCWAEPVNDENDDDEEEEEETEEEDCHDLAWPYAWWPPEEACISLCRNSQRGKHMLRDGVMMMMMIMGRAISSPQCY